MSHAATLPAIIQGGMGVGISNWVLARAVSRAGHLGVVSGTVVDHVMVRRLADGDEGGHVRRAMEAFPFPDVVAHVLDRYFKPNGREEGEPYPNLPMFRQTMKKARLQLTVLANFVEVHLAKEGHEGQVGINLLTKVQMPNLASLYGAMLANVDYVLMGAGIPREIPGVLDSFTRNEKASIRFDVEESGGFDCEYLEFDPAEQFDGPLPKLERPKFLAIVASNSLATMLLRKATGKVDGFIIEAPSAGGHNAPPRGERRYDENGEPVYGPRDEVDLEKFARLGVPFWLAGGAGRKGRLQEALDAGATGIQVGTLFAYCDESGLAESLRHRVIQQSLEGTVRVRTDDRASPTGFPFKVVELDESLSEQPTYERRNRVCDLGYLRTAFRTEKGRIGYRCASEPVETYVKKGGRLTDTEGRKCLCNALMSNLDRGQLRNGGSPEKPMLTSGDDLENLGAFLAGRDSYTAQDVLDYLLS
ncbi:MAG: nitronate monooxygenase [marine benthic group bacterium]|jgi:NAD(P)H-dependent flavin oxidoreductase YrpB (nitropropane dioxygenase family)|nr:nitronate monooxygenase [Gemmatimonadota bacterium]MCL7961318.1 nitronate monooxygenase [Candidatus Carthagonibacter metallireducens]MCL7969912.1 nitronate monooxygenase [Gemmatimonadota bacterium]MCL7981418.1 nitronate monooxygenase [Gemmatimonadota bacterium]MCL7985956.1 nitronate monooxygenase [Gemmatimonadota bacterium]